VDAAGAASALGAVAAVAGATGVVLRDVVAYDRPPAPPRPPRPVREPAPPVVVREPEPPAVVVREPVAPVVAHHEHDERHHDGSMLAGLATVEHDEHSALRRAGALAVLLTVTLTVAAALGAGIYRLVSGLK
jgi:hypothetical protein